MIIKHGSSKHLATDMVLVLRENRDEGTKRAYLWSEVEGENGEVNAGDKE